MCESHLFANAPTLKAIAFGSLGVSPQTPFFYKGNSPTKFAIASFMTLLNVGVA